MKGGIRRKEEDKSEEIEGAKLEKKKFSVPFCRLSV
jgi:hypothetical protein